MLGHLHRAASTSVESEPLSLSRASPECTVQSRDRVIIAPHRFHVCYPSAILERSRRISATQHTAHTTRHTPHTDSCRRSSRAALKLHIGHCQYYQCCRLQVYERCMLYSFRPCGSRVSCTCDRKIENKSILSNYRSFQIIDPVKNYRSSNLLYRLARYVRTRYLTEFLYLNIWVLIQCAFGLSLISCPCAVTPDILTRVSLYRLHPPTYYYCCYVFNNYSNCLPARETSCCTYGYRDLYSYTVNSTRFLG